MKITVKSITLTIDEVAQLIAVSDESERSEIMKFLKERAADPHSESPDSDAPKSSVATLLAEKIRRKADAAMRRKQARIAAKTRIAEKETDPSKENPTIEAEPNNLSDTPDVTLPLSGTIPAKIQWIRSHHELWARAFFGLFSSIIGSDIPAALARKAKAIIDELYDFIAPLFPIVSRHPNLRPASVTLKAIKTEQHP